jgi:hypothetical protein
MSDRPRRWLPEPLQQRLERRELERLRLEVQESPDPIARTFYEIRGKRQLQQDIVRKREGIRQAAESKIASARQEAENRIAAAEARLQKEPQPQIRHGQTQ